MKGRFPTIGLRFPRKSCYRSYQCSHSQPLLFTSVLPANAMKAVSLSPVPAVDFCRASPETVSAPCKLSQTDGRVKRHFASRDDEGFPDGVNSGGVGEWHVKEIRLWLASDR